MAPSEATGWEGGNGRLEVSGTLNLPHFFHSLQSATDATRITSTNEWGGERRKGRQRQSVTVTESVNKESTLDV